MKGYDEFVNANEYCIHKNYVDCLMIFTGSNVLTDQTKSLFQMLFLFVYVFAVITIFLFSHSISSRIGTLYSATYVFFVLLYNQLMQLWWEAISFFSNIFTVIPDILSDLQSSSKIFLLFRLLFRLLFWPNRSRILNFLLNSV
jgi:hypothetical protein